MLPNIIICGKMASGKTTIKDIIMKIYPEYIHMAFGQKVKDIAKDLFDMNVKNRDLLVKIGTSMREIDPDIWAKYVIDEIEHDKKKNCIIDDLRFQNEADYLKDWTFISLITPRDVRIKRITKLYPHNFEDHIKNMDHVSETGELSLPGNVVYIDTSIPFNELEKKIINLI